MDPNTQGAADLLRALMRTAARFSETARALSRDHFPHVRAQPIADLAGPAVRLGMELALPGHELVCQVAVGILDGGFTVRGELVLDDEDSPLALPLTRAADVAGCVTLLDRYAEELAAPARWHVTRLLET